MKSEKERKCTDNVIYISFFDSKLRSTELHRSHELSQKGVLSEWIHFHGLLKKWYIIHIICRDDCECCCERSALLGRVPVYYLLVASDVPAKAKCFSVCYSSFVSWVLISSTSSSLGSDAETYQGMEKQGHIVNISGREDEIGNSNSSIIKTP